MKLRKGRKLYILLPLPYVVGICVSKQHNVNEETLDVHIQVLKKRSPKSSPYRFF